MMFCLEIKNIPEINFLYCIWYMPYTIRKVRGRPCYRVKNRRTKRVFAKCTSKKNAKSQIKLLHAIDAANNYAERQVVKK